MPSALLVALVARVFPGLMALSASMDLMTMTIPNAIPLALALGYLGLSAALGLPAETVAFGLACGLAVLGVAFFMFTRNWIGGGDAKLAAAIALWLGWGGVLDFAVTASILRRVADPGDPRRPHPPVARGARAPDLDRPAPAARRRCSLRNRAGGGRRHPVPAQSRLAGRGRLS